MLKFNGGKLAELLKSLSKKQWQNVFFSWGAKGKKILPNLKSAIKGFLFALKEIEWKKLPAKLKNKLKSIKFSKTKKILKKMSDSWKVILTVVPLFFIFYYGLGSKIVENIDIENEYKIDEADKAPLFKTADGMAFLIRREVDDKMWTPNLPLIFPAHLLDNMPNFQTGIIAAVRDVAGTMRYFKHNTEEQNKDVKSAYKLLNYAPDVWIMSRKGKFNLAPSSNSQYRKAANELRKFMRDGIYNPDIDDLRLLLGKISNKLQKLTLESEDFQRENSTIWLLKKDDDLFYRHKGYAFALWQISKVLCHDYKKLIVENNLYEDWIRLSASLQKAAEFSPLIIRNGSADAVFTPNHLLMQNYYLLRGISAAEKMRGNLSEVVKVD